MMTRLQKLGLSKNKLRGTLPVAWSHLTQLTVLWLNDNDIEGQLPEAWKTMTRLQTLHLHTNKLRGTLPAAWSSMPIGHVDVHGNALSGELSSALLNAWLARGSLVYVDMSQNAFTGFPSKLGMDEMSGAPIDAGTGELTLKLSHNPLDENATVPWEWFDEEQSLQAPLEVFERGKARAFRRNAMASRYMGTLSTLELSNISISGTVQRVMDPLAGLARLKSLDVSGNDLHGHLDVPHSPFEQRYCLSNNNSGGCYVASLWGCFESLAVLQLQGNALLTGPLPPVIGHGKGDLLVLNAENCNLTNAVPATPTFERAAVLRLAGNVHMRAPAGASPPELPRIMAPSDDWADTGTHKQCAAVRGSALCPEGVYSLDASYVDFSLQRGVCRCAPGFVADGDECTDPLATCAPGLWTDTYANRCQRCVNTVDACPVGTYQAHDLARGTCACAACPPGTHAMTQGAVGRCTPCPTGTYQATAGASSCGYCPAGTASNATAATSAAVCKDCPYGKFAGQGQHVCSECPGNADTSGATCPAGTYRKNRQIDCACTNCPAGTFNPHAATSATSGSTSCDKCPMNTFASDVSPNKACKTCIAGKHAPELGAAYCRACPVGSAFDAGTKACAPCAAGRFQNVPGQIACKKCPCGKKQAAMGKTHCIACSYGKGTTAAGSTTCETGVTSCAGAATTPTLPPLVFRNITALEALSEFQMRAASEDMYINGQKTRQAYEACEAKTAPPATATASSAGLVAIDANGDGKVDVTDAIELFVATTMQDFGAAGLLDQFRKKYPASGAVTPIETVIANVKAAMAHGQQ